MAKDDSMQMIDMNSRRRAAAQPVPSAQLDSADLQLSSRSRMRATTSTAAETGRFQVPVNHSTPKWTQTGSLAMSWLVYHIMCAAVSYAYA